jgi:NitT/TauT family transport system substrate-binding protein
MHTPTRRSAIGSLAASTLIGVPGVVRAQARTPVIVETSTPFDVLPFFYGMQQGLFAKAGLDITVQMVTSGSLAMVAIAGGSAQLGFSNTLSLITAFARGIPAQMVAPGSAWNPSVPNNTVFVDADSPIHTAKDLEGHIVGVSGLHDLFSLSIRNWAQIGGADVAKISFVELPPSSMISSIKAKRIDAFMAYDPFRTAAIAAGCRALTNPYDAIGKGFLTGVWFGLGDWLKQNHDAAIQFARVIHTAAAFTNTHFEELVPLIVQFSKNSPDVVRQSAPAFVPPSLTAAAVQPVIDVAAKFGEIKAPFRASEILLPGAP